MTRKRLCVDDDAGFLSDSRSVVWPWILPYCPNGDASILGEDIEVYGQGRNVKKSYVFVTRLPDGQRGSSEKCINRVSRVRDRLSVVGVVPDFDQGSFRVRSPYHCVLHLPVVESHMSFRLLPPDSPRIFARSTSEYGHDADGFSEDVGTK